MLTHFIKKILNKELLSMQEAEEVMELLFSSDPLQVAAFLTLLKSRGETSEELAGIVKALKQKALTFSFSRPLLDIAGTGGDFSQSVNISTGSAILAAACGIIVAKHGNRSVSSKCGSADVLEALHIQIDMEQERALQCLEEVGISFLFAPLFHPAFKHFSSMRKKLEIPTIFNLVATLLNPSNPSFALIGVAHLSHLDVIAEAALLLKKPERALIFSGNGLDELSCTGKIHAIEISDGWMKRFVIDPQALGFSLSSLQDLKGGSPKENAHLLVEVFKGKKGAIADALVLNAAAALWIYRKAHSLEEGIFYARKVLEDKEAYLLLEKWRKFSKNSGGVS